MKEPILLLFLLLLIVVICFLTYRYFKNISLKNIFDYCPWYNAKRKERNIKFVSFVKYLSYNDLNIDTYQKIIIKYKNQLKYPFTGMYYLNSKNENESLLKMINAEIFPLKLVPIAKTQQNNIILVYLKTGNLYFASSDNFTTIIKLEIK